MTVSCFGSQLAGNISNLGTVEAVGQGDTVNAGHFRITIEPSPLHCVVVYVVLHKFYHFPFCAKSIMPAR